MPRILIVDDEGSIRKLLSTTFQMAGYDVRTAPDGPEAIDLCAAEPFDAMLSDVMMPRMNGHDLARWVAANRPQTRVVLMSGFDAGCQSCSFAPRCQFLPKPFRPFEAIAMVGDALAGPPIAIPDAGLARDC